MKKKINLIKIKKMSLFITALLLSSFSSLIFFFFDKKDGEILTTKYKIEKESLLEDSFIAYGRSHRSQHSCRSRSNPGSSSSTSSRNYACGNPGGCTGGACSGTCGQCGDSGGCGGGGGGGGNGGCGGGTGGGGCCIGEETKLIVKNRGTIAVKNIFPGNFVKGIDGSWNKVIDVSPHDNKIYKIDNENKIDRYILDNQQEISLAYHTIAYSTDGVHFNWIFSVPKENDVGKFSPRDVVLQIGGYLLDEHKIPRKIIDIKRNENNVLWHIELDSILKDKLGTYVAGGVCVGDFDKILLKLDWFDKNSFFYKEVVNYDFKNSIIPPYNIAKHFYHTKKVAV